jgi:alpha-ketoglutarate-dependent taurine dioxygenase
MADYVLGNFGWHIDGCTPHGDEFPPMMTMLTVETVAEGGDTEFASTYAAYDNLSDDEKTEFESLRVLHSFEAAISPFLPNPTPEQSERLRSQPTRVHPLVWHHESGRRSLVIGTHAVSIEGMEQGNSTTLLTSLLDQTTQPERVYRHKWSPGDTVIWDNRGLVHRVRRYDISKPREMFRTTVLGQEPIQ